MSPEQIRDKYAERIVSLLDGIVAQIREDEPSLQVSEIDELQSDDYRWTFNVCTAEQAEQSDEMQGVDVWFVICESEEYDGEENGVNFAIEIVGVGGEIVGGLTPYNYTDRCWVQRDDADAVEKRFRIIERADPCEAVCLVANFLKGE